MSFVFIHVSGSLTQVSARIRNRGKWRVNCTKINFMKRLSYKIISPSFCSLTEEETRTSEQGSKNTCHFISLIPSSRLCVSPNKKMRKNPPPDRTITVIAPYNTRPSPPQSFLLLLPRIKSVAAFWDDKKRESVGN